MYLDHELQFSDAQALTATAASTNVIDLGSDRDIGPGKQLYVVVTAGEALAGTTPTLQVALQTDDNEAFSSAITITESREYGALAAGEQIVIPMPYGTERYLRLNYTLGGTSPTVTVTAGIVVDVQSWKALPDAI